MADPRAPRGGRNRLGGYPRGRQADAGAVERVRGLLGGMARSRDMLIEALHLVQDACRCLPPGHLAALAQEFNLPLVEVYETATFYHHFDVLADGEEPPPEITVRVCDSIACEVAGAAEVIAAARKRSGGSVRILRAPCMGACDRAPAAVVGKLEVAPATPDRLQAAIEAGDTAPRPPESRAWDAYVKDGGYRTARDCLEGRRTREAVMEALSHSGLRGLGGAGFPTGRKWRTVAGHPRPRLMAVNADEGEPGTFKDRHFMETDPHRFLEGVLIGMWAVEAEACYIYLRDEYPAVREILLGAVADVERAGLCRPGALHLRRGAGAYICGEESAMLESIEGKRGLPRHRPPFAAEVGLFGRPTLVNNVETLFWIRDILERGAEWFSGHGRNGGSGMRAFSVSGRVREPGVKIADAGITVAELIDEHCGGMAPGHRLMAYLPGGASGGMLPASKANIPLDFGALEDHGCLIGSAAVVVLSDRDCVAAAARNLMRFFADESCGQCTPCRAGCEKAVELMEEPGWDRQLLEQLSQAMSDASICGLGQAAPNGLLSVFRDFPGEVPGAAT